MAQLLPDKEQQKPLAWLLLVVAVIVFYYVFVHWAVIRHLEINDQAQQRHDQEVRFRQLIAQRDQLQEQLREVRQSQSESDLFLAETNANLASSELTTRLKDIINNQGRGETCQVLSNQNMNNRDEERFERVTIKVRMRCEVEDLSEVLYELESGAPYLFVDNLTIFRQVTRRRVGRELVEEKMLDVRFDLSGYMRGEKKVQA